MAEKKTSPAEAVTSSSVGPESSLKDSSCPVREWSIRFAPGAEFMLKRRQSSAAAARTEGLGGLAVRASMAAVPPLEELDPERCYISWEMVLATTAGREAIRDVFIFVEDSCELVIEPILEPISVSEPSATASAQGASAALSAAEVTARALDDKRENTGGRRNYDAPDNATQPARTGRQAGPVCGSGGRAGDGAGAAERDCRQARRHRDQLQSQKRLSG